MKVLLKIMCFETTKDLHESVIEKGIFHWDTIMSSTAYRPKHVRFTFELDVESPRKDDMLVFDCTNVEIM